MAEDTKPDPNAAAVSPPAAAAPPQETVAAPALESPVVAAPAEPTVAETPTLLETSAPAEVKAEPAKPEVAAGTKPADAKPTETKPAEAAKAEAPKPGDEKPAEKPSDAKPAETAQPAAIDWKYELPKNITMDDAQKGEFHAALEKFKTDPNEAAKEVLALGGKMMEQFTKDFAAETLKQQEKTFLDTRKSWATKWMADPEIGGAGHQTAMAAIARVRDYAVPQKDRAEFDQFLRVTGAGDHPAFGRLLHNLARYVDEPQAVDMPTDIKPPRDIGLNPNRRGRELLYDHPRSAANGRG